MTFKELFDKALAGCTEFRGDMYSAKEDFVRIVAEELRTYKKADICWDSVSASTGWGHSRPTVMAYQNHCQAHSSNSADLMEYKLCLTRGKKHTSWYDSYYEQKVKGYSEVRLFGFSDEEAEQMFTTWEIADVCKAVFERNEVAKDNARLEREFSEFGTNTEQTKAELIAKLTEAATEFKALDEKTRDYINNLLYKSANMRLSTW